MSIGISIQFLAGRYHATPWNHQVNEGVVEWPPSPWRILRSLVSAYYRLPEPPERNQLNQLVTRLAEHSPSYVLPLSTETHTRHYMPVWKEGKATTTKVFDTFRVLSGGTLSPDAQVKVVWDDVMLKEEENELLQQLCRQVSYLGRAESWAELSVVEETSIDFNAVPVEATIASDWEQEQVKVLVPLTSTELEGFRAALAILPKPKRGKTKWKAPADVLEALELDVADLHSQGWNGIPGTRWVTYSLKKASNKKKLSFFSQRQNLSTYAALKKPTFARFALVSNVLPNLTEAVSVGERFRQALMAWSKDEAGIAASVFLGRNPEELDEEGNPRPLQGQQHAWYLPEDIDNDGKIDHIVVYARKGFDSQQAIEALQKLPKVWGKEGFNLQTVLLSLGQTEDYGADGSAQEGKSLIAGKSNRWRSFTPMVLPRHPKRFRNQKHKENPKTGFQIDGPEQQALRLLKQLNNNIPIDGCVEDRISDATGREWLGWVAPNGDVLVKVRCLDEEETRGFKYSWQAFQRRRYQGDGKKGPDRGYWLELEFKEPQQGPIALGYAAHFGLGVFLPMF